MALKFLLILEVFSLFVVAALAAKIRYTAPDCRKIIGGHKAISSDFRNLIAILVRARNKMPKYSCQLESLAHVGFERPDFYLPMGPFTLNIPKLVYEVKTGSTRTTLAAFAHYAIRNWSKNIVEMKNVKEFGCQVSENEKRKRVVCLFQ
ncbi:hypothetical protein ANCCAN_10993 [Ancylostoma caninum]|uniref:SCP domain-containing protein n=1 Tax=Ancylostoma caninum TaxID=29170 RepID=A0A368GF71_ANCCA|nr:hypothetical protein ANCCAN_10993 [Ancylostoma caninum]